MITEASAQNDSCPHCPGCVEEGVVAGKHVKNKHLKGCQFLMVTNIIRILKKKKCMLTTRHDSKSFPKLCNFTEQSESRYSFHQRMSTCKNAMPLVATQESHENLLSLSRTCMITTRFSTHVVLPLSQALLSALDTG